MKKITNKFFNITYKSLLVFTIICLSIALIGATFFYENRSFDKFNPIPLILGSIVYLFLLVRLYKFCTKLNEKTKKYICIGLLVFHFILLFTSSLIISSVPQVDLIHILTGINSLNNTGSIININYFSIYPNNQFLLVILYNLQKLSPSHSQLLFNLLSSISITISSLFTYKTIKKLFNTNKAMLSLFICVFSPIFYLYVSYYYTDVLMLPFASMLFYLIVINDKETSTRKNIIYSLLIGVIAIIGYKIRAVSIFLLIAYFVYLIFGKRIKVLIKNGIPITLAALITLFSINTIVSKTFTDVNKDNEFPITHWIMMGLNEEKTGYYSADDYDLSTTAATKEDRINLNIDEIKNRISSSNPYKMTKLLVTKLISVWGKGDYSYQKYLDLVNDYNISYTYLLEDKNIILNYALQIIKISILVLAIMALIKLFNSNKLSVIAIAVFGAVLFYLIWEVCPRYGLSFLPWLIILASYSIEDLEEYINKINSKKAFKYIILSLSIIVLLFGFYKYTKKSYKTNTVAQSSSNYVEFYGVDKDSYLKQSVVLKSKFNDVYLKFRPNQLNNDNDTYLFELLDEENNVLYAKEFTHNDVNRDKYTRFSLDKTYPKGNYYLKLSTNSNTKLRVYLSYKEEFDFYPEGNLYINELLSDGDIQFEVEYEEKRGTYSYVGYTGFMIITIVLEYVILFKKEEEVI